MNVEAPTNEELIEAWEDNGNDFFDIVQEVAAGGWRHGTYNTDVWRRVSDDTFWQCKYRQSTDGEYSGMRDNEFDVAQVWPREVVKIEYTTVPL